jgi:hypothetical protein
MCPKTIARQTIWYATENSVQNKIQNPQAKPNQIYALTMCQPPKEGKQTRERESYLFPSQLLRELQTESNLQALKLTTKLI